MISLSTSWLSHRYTDGYDMLKDMADLGFEYCELSHGIQISLIPGIFKALNENLIKISSCHNFCPLPPHVTQAAPNVYQPSSPDSRELDLWVRHSMRTIDTTVQVKASKVVAHMGSLFFFLGDPSKKLKAKLKEEVTAEELQEDEVFIKMREKLLRKMTSASPKHIKRIFSCLEKLQNHALENNVMICAENREGILELPMDSDTYEFFGKVSELGMVQLWHDTGHAKLKERMGFMDHASFLEENGEYIAGYHIHDCTPNGKDHQPIGKGNIDFDMVKKHFRPDQVFVLEFGPRVKKEEVLESKAILEGLVKSSPAGKSLRG